MVSRLCGGRELRSKQKGAQFINFIIYNPYWKACLLIIREMLLGMEIFFKQCEHNRSLHKVPDLVCMNLLTRLFVIHFGWNIKWNFGHQAHKNCIIL